MSGYYGLVHCGGCRPVVGGSVGLATPVVAVIACSGRRCFGSGVSRDSFGSGDTPRVLENLPGCQYRMTSYDAADQPDLNPAFSSMLGRLNRLACFPHTGLLVAPYDPRSGYLSSSSVAARRWPHHVKLAGVRTVCYVAESDVIRSHVLVVWARTIPVGGNPVHGAVSSCPSGGS